MRNSCHVCGEDNEEDAKYCSHCAAPLIERSCPECGALAARNAKFCNRCRALIDRPLGVEGISGSQKPPEEPTDKKQTVHIDLSAKKIPYCLSPMDFQHYLDTQAIMRFSRSGTVVNAVKQLHYRWSDPNTKVELLGNCVKVTPKQFPKIYEIVSKCSEIMYLYPPETYIKQSPQVNAYTTGAAQYFVVLHSALLDLMDENELCYVIGHELGHVKSDHVLYQQVAVSSVKRTLAAGALGGLISPWIEWGSITIAQSVITSIQQWLPMSELSADRAGLICCQDLESVGTAIIKLAVGSKSLFNEIDIEEYMKQYGELEYELARGIPTGAQTHPFNATRIKYLEGYFASPEYSRVFDQEYMKSRNVALENVSANVGQITAELEHIPLSSCPYCNEPTPSGKSFCKNCGVPLLMECIKCGTEIPTTLIFCTECGYRIVAADNEFGQEMSVEREFGINLDSFTESDVSLICRYAKLRDDMLRQTIPEVDLSESTPIDEDEHPYIVANALCTDIVKEHTGANSEEQGSTNKEAGVRERTCKVISTDKHIIMRDEEDSLLIEYGQLSGMRLPESDLLEVITRGRQRHICLKIDDAFNIFYVAFVFSKESEWCRRLLAYPYFYEPPDEILKYLDAIDEPPTAETFSTLMRMGWKWIHVYSSIWFSSGMAVAFDAYLEAILDGLIAPPEALIDFLLIEYKGSDQSVKLDGWIKESLAAKFPGRQRGPGFEEAILIKMREQLSL